LAVYPFRCTKCEHEFDIVESIKEYSGKATCPKCGYETTERLWSADIYFSGTSVQNAEYNPAFGGIVKNKKHRDELAKRHGLVEIGNEKPETIHKAAEQAREDKRKRIWDEA